MRTISIPDMWLAGRCHALRREGYKPKDALVQAIKDWLEQEELEEFATAYNKEKEI